VLLVNTYNEGGLQNKAQKVLQLMEGMWRKAQLITTARGIKKRPGKTWFDVDGYSKSYTANSENVRKEVLGKISEWFQLAQQGGYTPNTNWVSSNSISTATKSYRLFFHSEKLATADYILSTPPEVEVVLTKDLRMCDASKWPPSLIS